MPPKYPDIHVDLTGCDRAEYGPLARCLAAMARAQIPDPEQVQFTADATAGDYEDFLRVSSEWLATTE